MELNITVPGSHVVFLFAHTILILSVLEQFCPLKVNLWWDLPYLMLRQGLLIFFPPLSCSFLFSVWYRLSISVAIGITLGVAHRLTNLNPGLLTLIRYSSMINSSGPVCHWTYPCDGTFCGVPCPEILQIVPVPQGV